MEFDIQTHLTQMEIRIRQDIADVGIAARRDADEASKAAATALAVANAAVLANTQLEGRVKPLEEKAGWIGAGFAATFLSLCGVLWKVLLGHP